MSPQKTPVKEPLRDNPNISKLPVKKHEIDLLDLSFEPEKPEVNTSQSPMTVPEMIFNPTMPPNMQIPSYMTS